MHSGRVRKFHSSVIAVLPPASVKDGVAGNGTSARAIPTIARTRHGHSVRGRKTMANTGASTGAFTRSTARATVTLPDGGNAIGGTARPSSRSLQRWTRHGRDHPYRQALIGWFRRPPRGLQRWTRASWKSLWFQRHTLNQGRRRKFAKRGRDRGRWGSADSVAAWRYSAWILICIAWNCALPAPAWWSHARWRGLRVRSSAAARLCRALRWPIRRSSPGRAADVWF